MVHALKTTPQDILEGPILKTLVRLAIPTIVAFIFHTGFNFIDRFFVSRLGEIEFGALGMAFSLQMVLIATGSGLGIGTSSLISRLVGAKEFENANKAADQALLLILLCTLVATIGGLAVVRPLFHLLGASEQMYPFIIDYITVILYGAAFQFFSMIGNGILRGEGDTVTPMRVMLTGTFINIILDPLLIFGYGPFPEMGVRGAAVATVTARALSCLVLVFSYFSHRNIVKPTLNLLRAEFALMRGIIVVGGPAVIGNLLHPIGMATMFFLLRTYGDASKAALTMGLTYQQIAILPIIGVASATLTMAGQNYGAAQLHRIRELNTRAVVFCMILLSGVTMIFILGSSSFARVFSDSPEVIAISQAMLIITSLGFPFIGTRIVQASLFQGIGMGVKALLLNGSQVLIFSLPCAWLMSRWFGLNGIWFGMTAGIVVAAIVGMLWMKSTLDHLHPQGSENLSKKDLTD